MVLITIVNGVYKPTYNRGPHIVRMFIHSRYRLVGGLESLEPLNFIFPNRNWMMIQSAELHYFSGGLKPFKILLSCFRGLNGLKFYKTWIKTHPYLLVNIVCINLSPGQCVDTLWSLSINPDWRSACMGFATVLSTGQRECQMSIFSEMLQESLVLRLKCIGGSFSVHVYILMVN